MPQQRKFAMNHLMVSDIFANHDVNLRLLGKIKADHYQKHQGKIIGESIKKSWAHYGIFDSDIFHFSDTRSGSWMSGKKREISAFTKH